MNSTILKYFFFFLLVTAILSLLGCTHSRIDRSVASSSSAVEAIFETDSLGPYNAIYALSDIHGMYANLIQLLRGAKLISEENLWIGGPSLILILGDDLNKGSDSIEVLDLWISLEDQISKAGGKLVHLLGNHEREFLVNPTNKHSEDLIKELALKKIFLDDVYSLSSKRGKFLRSEFFAARIGKWWFSHAGFYPKMTWQDLKNEANDCMMQGNYECQLISDENSFIEAKNWWKDTDSLKKLKENLAENKLWGIVFGHIPKAFQNEGEIGLVENGQFIKIDTGMSSESGSRTGRILKFPHPKELLKEQIPKMFSIDPSGKKILLK